MKKYKIEVTEQQLEDIIKSLKLRAATWRQITKDEEINEIKDLHRKTAERHEDLALYLEEIPF